jgi:hypothetical protein
LRAKLLQFIKHTLGNTVEIPAKRTKVVLHRSVHGLVVPLHMATRNRLKHKPAPTINLTKTEPILAVDLSRTERGRFSAVDFFEPGRFLGDECVVVFEHVHDEICQSGEVLGISRVLEHALVVDVGEEIRLFEIAVVVLRVTEVLRRHNSALDPIEPGIPSQGAHETFTEEVSVAAGLYAYEAVVRGAKGYEGADGRGIAAFDVAAEEEASLAEADCVDCGGCGEYWVSGKLGADFFDLFGHVALVGGHCVLGATFFDEDVVDQGSGVDCVG